MAFSDNGRPLDYCIPSKKMPLVPHKPATQNPTFHQKDAWQGQNRTHQNKLHPETGRNPQPFASVRSGPPGAGLALAGHLRLHTHRGLRFIQVAPQVWAPRGSRQGEAKEARRGAGGGRRLKNPVARSFPKRPNPLNLRGTFPVKPPYQGGRIPKARSQTTDRELFEGC